MDHGWILTFASEASARPQLSVASEDGSKRPRIKGRAAARLVTGFGHGARFPWSGQNLILVPMVSTVRRHRRRG
jgi:hypothetical protein